ncbi:MAG: hypothetical protein RJQ04_19115 [Longimicrobiales bacterium]
MDLRTPAVRLFAAVFLMTAAWACASGGSGGADRPDADRISAAELEADQERDVLTLIQRLRPRWLQTRGSDTFSGQVGAAVIIDGMQQQSGLGALRQIRAVEVESIEFMNARDATTRYGMNMAGGAILVTMKR